MTKKNRHGLSRHIPEDIKKEIRITDGFGCIFCGCPIIEYEHIKPEFHDARKHDPKCMTLLCANHHNEVTKGIISKEKVLEKKSARTNMGHSIVYNDEYRGDIQKIFIGNNLVHISEKIVVLLVSGEPLLWLEPDLDNEYGAIKLNGSFHDSTGKKIIDITNNEYKITSQRLCSDITFIGSVYKIKDKNENIIFEMDFSSPMRLVRMKTTIENRTIEICKDGSLKAISGGGTVITNGCIFQGSTGSVIFNI